MKKFILYFAFVAVVIPSFSQKNKSELTQKSNINESLVSNLKFRSIGPAFISGRIADIAVNPNNPDEFYLAVASGGVWKTSNHGNTYQPVFDSYGSYSTGCVTIDPNNTNIVWVGTGENNNQRSVAYGDGVYKSEDGGKSWKNMGLKKSEHISKIIVDPKNSDIVYVAAYGPLWSEGGDRGIYKTIDGGKNWERILHVSDNTGMADLIMDPFDNNTLYASAHQRRRHVFTYVGGGKESALYKSTDGGKTWNELKSGLPTGKMGRVGLAISPVNSNYIYAIVEAEDDKSGFYRSTNKGASWEKRSSYVTSGNYYQEIICDPKDVNKVFSMDTWLHHTEDGGLNFKATGEKSKHVDNHCIWINPNNTDHWIVGCDGGIYETWDHAKNWQWTAHLPLAQFYKVTTDNDTPFYNIYGGTQDNNSLGGPSQTTNIAGIVNSDWFITNGGDGFESQVDPKNPNIVYAQAQYGWLVRYDKQSGEKMGIQPMPRKGEAAYRWNWDAPLVISEHNHKRLYFAANKVFKSDDMGNTWQVISDDLTRQLDRNSMKVMGEIQTPEVVMKNMSTTIYGNITALAESPKNENLLFVGTDDGLIQITSDGGKNWTKKESFSGVPNQTYVNMIIASQHNENVVYAAFNNHKNGDFKPYLMKSTDKGNSWQSIAANLPERGSVYSIAEDHVNPNLLFAGTEFGVFFTIDGGKNWIQLKGGLPTIAVRDLAIQKRENDLVLATFGRGFYILDNYSVLRELTEENLNKEAHVFSIKPALQFIPSSPLGGRGKSDNGESYYTGDNPTFGAVFRYHIKSVPKSPKDIRKEKEKEAQDKKVDINYPSNEDFFKEDNYEEAYLLFIIRDQKGNEVNRIQTSASEGLNTVSWNLRYPATTPIKLSSKAPGRYSMPDEGPMVLPGKYTVELHLNEDGKFKKLTEPTEFEVKLLENSTLARQTEQNIAFKKELGELRREFRGTSKLLDELENRLSYIKAAIQQYPGVDLAMMDEVKDLEKIITTTYDLMYGEAHLAKRETETLPGAGGRIETIVYQTWYSTSNPTSTQKEQFEIAKEEYAVIKNNVLKVQNKVTALEEKLNVYGVPYTPNRENFREE